MLSNSRWTLKKKTVLIKTESPLRKSLSNDLKFNIRKIPNRIKTTLSATQDAGDTK